MLQNIDSVYYFVYVYRFFIFINKIVCEHFITDINRVFIHLLVEIYITKTNEDPEAECLRGKGGVFKIEKTDKKRQKGE